MPVNGNTKIATLATQLGISADGSGDYKLSSRQGSWFRVDKSGPGASTARERVVLVDPESVRDADLLQVAAICVRKRAPMCFRVSDADRFLKIVAVGAWQGANIDVRFGADLVFTEGQPLAEQIASLEANLDGA